MFRDNLLRICDFVRKLLYVTASCFLILSMLLYVITPKRVSSQDEELVNFTLDHNQCLSSGLSADTLDYYTCMENLQKQRQSVRSI